MENSDWTGVVIAAVLAALSFGVARLAVRHFARKRAAREQAVPQAAQSRQMRRAQERKKK
jgi:flagellar biosynthesis/type III secretory pathway M-ring protein FliF/YscJ